MKFLVLVLICANLVFADDYKKEIDKLNYEIQKLKSDKSYQDFAKFRVYIDNLDNEFRKLNGRIEELTHENNMIRQELENFRSEIIKRMELANKASKANTSQTEYDVALKYYNESKLELAKEKFEDFKNKHPESNLMHKTYYLLGDIYFNEEDFKKSSLYYYQSYDLNKEGEYAIESLIKLASSLKSLNNLEQACTTYEKILIEFEEKEIKERVNTLKEELKC